VQAVGRLFSDLYAVHLVAKALLVHEYHRGYPTVMLRV
jgi:hypothetical protein